MARIRTIKPEFWTDEELSDLPEATHILAAALLNNADDFGWFNANPALVRAACSPIREPSVSIPESLRSLQTIGYIRIGTAPCGKRYGQIVKFGEHQRVSHPTESKIAKLSITWDEFRNPPENIRNPPEPFRPEQGTGNREQGKNQTLSSSPSANDAPADGPLSDAKAERLRQVTGEAIEAYNAILAKPTGLLPAVSKVGRHKRQDQIRRCLRTAREICAEQFGSPTVVPEFWTAFFGTCAADDFHSGRKAGGKGHENWTPDFEFLTREATMLKVYDRESSEGAP